MHMTFNPPRIRAFFTPTRTTFLASLLLSLIAWLEGTINRDGILYVKAAHIFLEDGFTAARAVFNWPFLSISMAVVAKISGLRPEHAGYLLNAIFMAGACSLMVACVERRQASVAWMSSLVVLTLPGVNEYRNELLREYGCWFFVMLAFWLSLRWSERPRWLSAVGIQIALGTAALFRPEALMLFPALIAWQWFDATHGDRWRRLLMLGALPLVGGIVLLSLHAGGKLDKGSRLAGEFSRMNTARFDAKAQALAATLIDYARVHARTILFFGSLSLIPLKLLPKYNLFLLPLAAFLVDKNLRACAARHTLFAWGTAAHLVVLAVFVLDQQFLAGRYVSLVLLFSTPFVAIGLNSTIRRFPRWRSVAVALALLLMLSNVISTGSGKTHFVDAGRWLADNVTDSTMVYIDSERTAYHAGWLKTTIAKRNDKAAIEQAVSSGKYELFALETSHNDPLIENWLPLIGLHVIKQFKHPSGDSLVVAGPTKKQP